VSLVYAYSIAAGCYHHEDIPNSVRNGMVWVGLPVPQGDKGGEVDNFLDHPTGDNL
jgi:hypothetical protein